MARLRDPEKRNAILEAAVCEIDAVGLGASTARIARRAGVAEGTLFTYFPTKEALLNELYLELKAEVYRKLSDGFPQPASLQERTRHIWSSYLAWGLEFPARRKVSAQLNISDTLTAETRARAIAEGTALSATIRELGSRAELHGLPPGFAASVMLAMQEAALEFAAKRPEHAGQIRDRAFEVFWRAFQ